MEMFVVTGGRTLNGTVSISGSKNATLPIMAAALTASGQTTLHGVPDLVDVKTLAELLRTLGMSVNGNDNGVVQLQVVDETPCIADYDLVRRMRASFCVLGPLLARRGHACVSLPGGCNIGDRPIELHLKGLRALGAEIAVDRGYVIAKAKRLRGNRVYLGGPFGSTVTGTCNVMAAAALAKGRTTIEAAACEPEVVDLGRYLNAMGARISGLGTPFIQIDGVDELHGCSHRVVSDRIEAATFMVAAAITRGDIVLQSVHTDHLTAVIEKLRDMGVGIDVSTMAATGSGTAADVRITMRDDLKASDCCALPYPGIPTDIQAQLMALLSQAPGFSIITDKVFPDRFMHVAELARLGATIRREGGNAIISGPSVLSGACVMASDLRASAALVLAALAAKGTSVIRRIYHLDRGYEQLDLKLNRLGADVRRVVDEPDNMPASLRLNDEIQRSIHGLRPPRWLSHEQAPSVTHDAP